jgi:hypothetical protein
MSRKITLKNEQIASYLNTDDAIKALSNSVNNGQIRIALQILVEIIEDLNNSINIDKVSHEEKPSKKSEETKVTAEKQQTKQKVEQASSELENNA